MSTQTTATKPASVWKHGLAATVAAALVVTGIAALASEAGVSFLDPASNLSIPLSGFAVLTVAFSLIGVALAAILARTAKHPRSTFVRTTLVLLVLSIVPDFVEIPNLSPDFDTASSVTLAALHLVAAAIVIPVLARRLASER
jgi:uncharacterized membrane protein YoaK (UPF0700 family)